MSDVKRYHWADLPEAAGFGGEKCHDGPIVVLATDYDAKCEEVERLRARLETQENIAANLRNDFRECALRADRAEARLAAAEASLASDTVAVSALNVELKARLAEEIDARMKWEDEWQKVYAQVAKAERDAERLREDAERWRSLNNDCDAQPCRWPCLRDDLADWTAATSPAPTTATP